MRVRYREEGGEIWNREYTGSHTVRAAAGEGRIAVLGTTDGGPGQGDPRDRISVLARASGALLFSVPVPSDARVEHLGFDATGRLWVTGRSAGTYEAFARGTSLVTDVREYPFVLIFDDKGVPAGWLWAATPGATITDAPVFLRDGRAVLGLRTSRPVRVQSSFAGEASFGVEHSLLALELDARRAARFSVPQNTSCLSPARDGHVLACVQHLVRQGNVSWAASCDLVSFHLLKTAAEAG
jgi:hypothetical protein